MGEQLCVCSSKMLDPQDSNYVWHGQPVCSRACLLKAEENYARKVRARLDQQGRCFTRIVGSFEDGFHVVG